MLARVKAKSSTTENDTEETETQVTVPEIESGNKKRGKAPTKPKTAKKPTTADTDSTVESKGETPTQKRSSKPKSDGNKGDVTVTASNAENDGKATKQKKTQQAKTPKDSAKTETTKKTTPRKTPAKKNDGASEDTASMKKAKKQTPKQQSPKEKQTKEKQPPKEAKQSKEKQPPKEPQQTKEKQPKEKPTKEKPTKEKQTKEKKTEKQQPKEPKQATEKQTKGKQTKEKQPPKEPKQVKEKQSQGKQTEEKQTEEKQPQRKGTKTKEEQVTGAQPKQQKQPKEKQPTSSEAGSKPRRATASTTTTTGVKKTEVKPPAPKEAKEEKKPVTRKKQAPTTTDASETPAPTKKQATRKPKAETSTKKNADEPVPALAEKLVATRRTKRAAPTAPEAKQTNPPQERLRTGMESAANQALFDFLSTTQTATTLPVQTKQQENTPAPPQIQTYPTTPTPAADTGTGVTSSTGSNARIKQMPRDYPTIIKDAIQSGQPLEALDAFERMLGAKIKPSLDICNLLLASLTQASHLDKASSILSRMHKTTRRLPAPSAYSYDLLIDGFCRRSSNADTVYDLYHQMVSNGLKPSLFFYNKLVRLLVSTDNKARAEELLDRMREDYRLEQFDTEAFNTMILYHYQYDEFKAAYHALETMRKLGCPPDSYTYTLEISILVAIGKEDEAFTLLDKSLRHGPTPAKPSFIAVLEAREKRGEMDAVFRLIQEMKWRGLDTTSADVVKLLVTSLTKRGAIAQARAIFDSATKNLETAKDLTPYLPIYNTLIDFYCKNGPFDEASALAETLRKRGIENTITYNMLIDYYCKHDALDKARILVAELRYRRVPISSHTYNSLMNAYAKRSEVQEARLLFDQMLQENIAPNIANYCVLIEGYGRAKQLDKALELFEQLKMMPNLKADAQIISVLMDACGHNNKIDVVMRLFTKDMPALGIVPNTNLFNSAIEACGRCGRLDEADFFMRELINLVTDKSPKNDSIRAEFTEKSLNTIMYNVYSRNKVAKQQARAFLLAFATKLGPEPDQQQQHETTTTSSNDNTLSHVRRLLIWYSEQEKHRAAFNFNNQFLAEMHSILKVKAEFS